MVSRSLLDGLLTEPAGTSVLFVHAHPDDDTLSTGPLVAWLARHGATVGLLTCTRGERGEVVPGVLTPGASADELIAQRERELAGACSCLGVRDHGFLGSAPWRAAGLAGRRYEDSGMRWITPTVAGPAGDAGPDSLTLSDRDEEIADLVAGLSDRRPDLLLSYDDGGGYGHPDHRRVHDIAVAAAGRTGIGIVQVLSHEDVPGVDVRSARWFQTSEPPVEQAVLAALGCYRSQLCVVGEGPGRHIRHVGGQFQEIPRRVGLLDR